MVPAFPVGENVQATCASPNTHWILLKRPNPSSAYTVAKRRRATAKRPPRGKRYLKDFLWVFIKVSEIGGYKTTLALSKK